MIIHLVYWRVYYMYGTPSRNQHFDARVRLVHVMEYRNRGCTSLYLSLSV